MVGFGVRSASVLASALAVLWLGPSLSCVSDGANSSELAPVRISGLLEGRGPDARDAARRASLLLVDEGLDSDSRGLPRAALARYERAIQVDATNPYAYLAIARHHVDAHDPILALQFLDHAESLMRMRGDLRDAVQVHLFGLRGAALYDSGRRPEAAELLDRARALSPRIWGDGSLHPDELR